MIRLRRWAAQAMPLLFAAGLLAFGYAAYVLIATGSYQHDQRTRFYHSRKDTQLQPDPVSIIPPEGETIGEISIERLGLSAMVMQGESETVLRHAVGHLADTALPGEVGNVVLAGHRDGFFRPLKNVRVGDAITIKTRTREFQYVVESTSVVPPSDISVLEPGDGRILTLITCFPFVFIGSAPDRFIVRARPSLPQ